MVKALLEKSYVFKLRGCGAFRIAGRKQYNIFEYWLTHISARERRHVRQVFACILLPGTTYLWIPLIVMYLFVVLPYVTLHICRGAICAHWPSSEFYNFVLAHWKSLYAFFLLVACLVLLVANPLLDLMASFEGFLSFPLSLTLLPASSVTLSSHRESQFGLVIMTPSQKAGDSEF